MIGQTSCLPHFKRANQISSLQQKLLGNSARLPIGPRGNTCKPGNHLHPLSSLLSQLKPDCKSRPFLIRRRWLAGSPSNQLKAVQIGASQDGSARTQTWNPQSCSCFGRFPYIVFLSATFLFLQFFLAFFLLINSLGNPLWQEPRLKLITLSRGRKNIMIPNINMTRNRKKVETGISTGSDWNNKLPTCLEFKKH